MNFEVGVMTKEVWLTLPMLFRGEEPMKSVSLVYRLTADEAERMSNQLMIAAKNLQHMTKGEPLAHDD